MSKENESKKLRQVKKYVCKTIEGSKALVQGN